MVGQLVVFNYLPQGLTPQYTRYIPSLIEIMAGAGVISYGLLSFTLGVKYLNVVNHEAVEEHESHVPQVALAGD
jgi:Ni/Fe-hydrogenase subunit HybB-like protein